MTTQCTAPSQGDTDRGSMSTELAVVAGVFVILLLFVVGLGRIAHGAQLVQQAASSAARAASLASTPYTAQQVGQQAAVDALAGAGVSCVSMSVEIDVSQFRAGGHVSATVTCTASLTDLRPTGLPPSSSTSATSTVPLETFRPFDGE